MKLISNQINPHFTLLDAIKAALQIFNFTESKTNWSEVFGTEHYVLTNTARSALGIIADTVKPDKNKRIGIPAFVCGVVATPFLQRGYHIEWIDTNGSGLMDPEDFAHKAKNISLIIVPHVFGQPARLKEIYKIAKQHNIFVVEDGAHFMNNNFDHSDVKIWSFGREKVVSCVAGGVLLWKKRQTVSILKKTTIYWQMRHALQPLIFAVAQPWWHLGGKTFPALMRKINFLPLAVTLAEKSGQEDIAIKSLGRIQQHILTQQWAQQKQRQTHAQEISHVWVKKLKPYLPEDTQIIIPENYFRVILKFKTINQKQNFLKVLNTLIPKLNTNDWDGIPISPSSVNLKKFGYRIGQCPQAETYAQTYLTLPTNVRINKRDLNKLDSGCEPTKIKT